jgi:hypothetical protein
MTAKATTHRPPARRLTRATAGVTLAVLLAGGLGACGEDEEAAQPDEVAADAGDGDGATGDATCDAAIELSGLFAMPPEEPDAVAGWANDDVLPLLEQLGEELEGDAAAAAGALVAPVEEVAGGGSPEALFAPEAAQSLAAIGAHVHESCDVNAIAVTAIDYGYEGLPEELDGGLTSFALTNDGGEAHEMVLMKRADGATESLDELLALPEEEALAKMQFTGVAFGDPGSTSYVTIDLEPGTYFVVCFIPVGGGEEGAPHFTQGMSAEFTVA